MYISYNIYIHILHIDKCYCTMPKTLEGIRVLPITACKLMGIKSDVLRSFASLLKVIEVWQGGQEHAGRHK